MNILSLFDGISAGQCAMWKLNFKYDNYLASEIDKYAIKVTQHNFPNTQQVGDITKLHYENFCLYSDNRPVFYGGINLLIGGSPCQGFSNAGDGLNFDDPRSKLFFEFIRLRDEILEDNPNLKFLLENVKMKKEWKNIITQHMGVEPILINSALVSAQNRERYYWTNIDVLYPPEDKGILLKDIIESGEVDRDKSYCLDANYYKGGNLRLYFNSSRRQLVKRQSTNRLMVKVGNAEEIKGHDYNSRVYDVNGKSPTLNSCGGGNLEPKIASEDMKNWRVLTVTEMERLQTFPDDYTKVGISQSQRKKGLGNSWTVDVIVHILSFL